MAHAWWSGCETPIDDTKQLISSVFGQEHFRMISVLCFLGGLGSNTTVEPVSQAAIKILQRQFSTSLFLLWK